MAVCSQLIHSSFGRGSHFDCLIIVFRKLLKIPLSNLLPLVLYLVVRKITKARSSQNWKQQQHFVRLLITANVVLHSNQIHHCFLLSR